MRKLVSLVAVAAAAMLVVGSAANAAPVKNPACDGTKIDPVHSGTYALPYADGLGFVTVTVRDTPDGQVLDYQTDSPFHAVSSLVAKGGPAYETYSPYASEGYELHAPVNPSSGKWYDLSYLCFTADLGGGGSGGGAL